MKRIIIISILTLFTFTLMACSYTSNEAKPRSEAEIPSKPQKVNSLSITLTGDILMNTPLLSAIKHNSSYDFKSIFTELNDVFSNSDFLISNTESSINPKMPLAGYPQYNAPSGIISAMAELGVDGLTHSNNHILDTGLDGLKNTVALTHDSKMQSIGVGLPDNAKYAIFTKDNIKVAVLGYTYGTNMGKQYKDYINYIDRDKIKSDISKLKNNEKPDYIIVYLHVGTEYVRSVEAEQQEITNYIADFGADAIIESHPHVARKSEIIKKQNKDVYVSYSMGNLVSNQHDKYTDIGTVVTLNIKKIGDKTYLDSGESIPTYRLKYMNNGKKIYKVIPLDKIDNFKNVINLDTINYFKNYSKEIEFKYKNQKS